MMFLDSYLVGFFLALVCGLVSPLVVVKRLSALTGSVSHTS
ncbi:metal ABC transporter permease, partial [bacterium]|nr:metal ABC transporter permease [bacterium]